MVKATNAEAQIATNKRKYVEESLAMVMSITTFSARLEDQFKEIRHQDEMRIIAKETAQAQLVEQQLKNMIMQNEVKLGNLEVEVKSKEMEKILGSRQD